MTIGNGKPIIQARQPYLIFPARRIIRIRFACNLVIAFAFQRSLFVGVRSISDRKTRQRTRHKAFVLENC